MRTIAKRYRIRRKIGSGSIGDVFLVEDLRENKEVCLKLLRKSKAAKSGDFAREFTLLTGLRHPGLVRVFDFGIESIKCRFNDNLNHKDQLFPVKLLVTFIHTHFFSLLLLERAWGNRGKPYSSAPLSSPI